jgi:predicted ester cyclase
MRASGVTVRSQEQAMSDNAHATIGRRFFQEQDRLRGGPAEALCAPDYVAVLGGNPPMSRDGHEAFARAFYQAFPDIHHEIVEEFAAGDRVAVRFILHGTHTGQFYGMPPTGKHVDIPANVLMHVADGRVTKLFGVFDEAGMMRQLSA